MSAVKKRSGHRTMAVRLVNEINNLLLDTEIEIFLLEAKLERLRHFKTEMLKFDELIQSELEDDELVDDMQDSCVRLEVINACIFKSEHVISRINDANRSQSESNPRVNACDSIPDVRTVKLPILQLPYFTGDSLEWPQFWDGFESAVHKRTDISGSNKFAYLVGQLKGEAFKLLEGFSLTNIDYNEAVQLLRDTYGQPHKIIQSHLHAIFDLKNPCVDATELSHFRSSYECHLRSLKNLGTNVEGAGFVFAALLLRKLPDKIRDNICRANKVTFWDLPEFRTAVNAEIEHLLALHPNKLPNTGKINVPGQNKIALKCENTKLMHRSSMKGNRSTIGNFAVSSNKDFIPSCKFCFDKHSSVECIKYIDPKLRLKRAKELNLCTNCLTNGHTQATCRSIHSCRVCQSKHNTALSFKRLNEANKSKVVRTPLSSIHVKEGERVIGDPSSTLQDENSITASSLILHTNQTKLSSVALPTASLPVQTPNGVFLLRALFDQGSQRTLMLRSVARQLNLIPGGRIQLTIDGFAAEGKLKTYETVTLSVKVEGRIMPMEAILVDKLPSRINIAGLTAAAQYLQSNNVMLADPNIHDDCINDVSVLIGSDYYYKFVKNYTKLYDITLLQSNLGKMISGPIPYRFINLSHVITDSVSADVTTVLHIDTDTLNSSLEESLQNIWTLDAIGILPERDLSYNAVLKDFMSSIEYKHGHYISCLPWKSNKHSLSTNYSMVRGRLLSNLKKLRQNPVMLDRYNNVFVEYLSRGFIERVDNFMEPHLDSQTHYLAHHGVEKNSSTTPLRIVFDCSAGKPSLNDCLFAGPPLLNDLTHILLRFRLKRFASISDISKAYLMITLHERDRDSTRFLWPENPCDPYSPLITYRFKVVLFGATCSQFILNATILHHLLLYNENDVAEAIHRNLYVDNLHGVADTEKDLENFYCESKAILNNAGLKLVEWATNSPNLQSLSNRNHDGISSDSEANVLGMTWNISRDCLMYPLRSSNKERLTKRVVVQQAAKIYDPLGYLTPVLIRSRIFIQDLWKAKFDWDDILPDPYVQVWNKIWTDVATASVSFSVPRQVVYGDSVILHAFSDASLYAYGAAIYFVDEMGHSNLVMAKARVAPLKELTIPKLELTAALLAARLTSHVLSAYFNELEFSSINMWSDSQIALCWINNICNQKITYVQNRVDEIRTLLPKANWRHVKSADNPSDLLSRGMTATAFLGSQIWVHGPSWLNQPDLWPSNTWSENVSDDNTFNDSNTVTVNATTVGAPPALFDVSGFSSLTKVLKITGLVLRFIGRLRGGALNHPVAIDSHNFTIKEIANSEQYWVMQSQKECFSSEFAYLESAKDAKPTPNLVLQLNLYLDVVLKCKGRLENSELPVETRSPVLLPYKHHLTKLIIQDLHNKYHSGVSATVNSLRQKWWFSKMRQQVRSVLRSCVICKRLQGLTYKIPRSCALPSERVKEARPFQITGLDYTGALIVRDDKQDRKVYIVLFTCAVTRAIHLELVFDNSAASFIQAFKRFANRRSCPQIIYSDNASTFHAASNYLRDIQNHPSVKAFLAEKRCEWRFIPAKSPWFGGFWERMVGLTKATLRKVLGRACVNSQELNTILVEIEGHLNDRPLTEVSDDLQDALALTPSQLIYGFRLNSPPSLILDSKDEDFSLKELITKREKRCRLLLQHFWRRWREEYLTALRDRHSAHAKSVKRTGSCSIKVGDIVIIHDDGPRLYWNLGRVQNLFRGRDGEVRSASLKTSSGIITRAIAKLYPLEISGPDELRPEPYVPVEEHKERPKRHAAEIAKQKISMQLLDDAA